MKFFSNHSYLVMVLFLPDEFVIVTLGTMGPLMNNKIKSMNNRKSIFKLTLEKNPRLNFPIRLAEKIKIKYVIKQSQKMFENSTCSF